MSTGVTGYEPFNSQLLWCEKCKAWTRHRIIDEYYPALEVVQCTICEKGKKK